MPDLLDLLRAARGGDAAAFDQLVAASYREVAVCLAATIGERDLAEELLYETYAIAYEQLDRYRGDGEPTAWLKGIARNLVRRELRRRRRAPPQVALDPDALPGDEAGPDPADQLRERRLGHLARCLEGLAPAARSLLRQRYEQQQAVQDLAQRLGRSAGALAKQLWTIRAQLRRCIEAQESEA